MGPWSGTLRWDPKSRILGWDHYHWRNFWKLLPMRWTLNQPQKFNTILNQNVFLRLFLFLICCNCPKTCLKVNKLQSPKAPCFSSPWKRQYVKSTHNVQEILCKQSAESVWIKKVIIFTYKFQLCNSNPLNSLQSLPFALRQPKEFIVDIFILYFYCR